MDIRFFRRKKVLIRPSYQIKLALAFFIYLAVYSVILGFVIFFPLYVDIHIASDMNEAQRISTIVLYLHKRVWAGLFLVSLLAGVHAIYSTHKLVGPMYRFEKMVEAMIKGDLRHRVSIRKGDEFRAMAGLLNRLADSLERSMEDKENMKKEITEGLASISASLDAHPDAYPQGIKDSFKRLRDSVNAH
ncbi:MAG: methyl-accepting chemotaxis protein [Deltaproteobacteria bacterium]